MGAMFGLRMPELLIILAVVLLVFGAKKLPQLGQGLGESVRSFRKAFNEAKPGADPDASPDVSKDDPGDRKA